MISTSFQESLILPPVHKRFTQFFFLSIFAFFFAHRHEQEKSQGVSEISELRRRIKQLEEENEEMSDNRLQLIGELLYFPLLVYCK